MILGTLTKTTSALAVFAFAVSACASVEYPDGVGEVNPGTPPIIAPSPEAEDPPISPPPTPAPEPAITVPNFTSTGNSTLDAWRVDFARRSIKAGSPTQVVEGVLREISSSSVYFDPDTKFAKSLSSPENQAEFAKAVWDYVDSATAAIRVSNGRTKLTQNAALLGDIETAYGVPASALLGIWGMETAYGGFLGNENAANMLSNMAAEGRRKAFAEGELRAIMTLVESGDYTPEDFKSSFAGAVGHTQFMPSNVIKFGQDYNKDGRVDLWSEPADALASAANYLRGNGYVSGTPWGVEVRLPQGFDYSLGDGRKMTVSQWRAKGITLVRPMNNGSLRGELWAPTGQYGPKFLLFPNFKAFKSYNNSDSYALSVGLLGDLVEGQSGLSQAWPKHLGRLSKADIKDLQAILTQLGHNPKGIDGIFGRNTANAVRRYQATQGMVADGYPTKAILAQLRAQ